MLHKAVFRNRRAHPSSRERDYHTVHTDIADYIKMPALVKYYVVGEVGNGLGLFLGNHISFKVWGTDKTLKTIKVEGEIIRKEEISRPIYSITDVGIIAGLGYDFNFGLSVDFRYDVGFTPLGPGKGLLNWPDRNEAISLSFAYNFLLTKELGNK